MKDLLTVFVPTYQRPAILRRKLYHMALQKCPYLILILDTSDAEVLEENQRTILEYQEQLNINYYQYPNTLLFGAKISEGAELVKTPYIITSFDDDFLNIDFLHKGLSFLEERQEYDAVTGYILSFIRPPNKNRGEHYFRLSILTGQGGFPEKDPLDRVKKFISERHQSNQIVNLRRSKSYKENVAILKYSVFHKYSEQMSNILLTLAGPMHMLDEIMEMRWIDYDKANFRKRSLPRFKSGLYEEFTEPGFFKQLEAFMDRASILLKNHFSQESALQDFVMRCYLSYRTRTLNLEAYRLKNKRKIASEKIYTILSKMDYFSIFFSPLKILFVIKLLKLYGIHYVLNMLKNDSLLQFNSLSLSSSKSKHHVIYRNSYEAMIENMDNF